MKRFHELLVAATPLPMLLLLAVASAQEAREATPLHRDVETLARQRYPELLALYQDLHANPELSFQEVRTAVTLARHMRDLGFDVTERVGRTGLVAVYRNGEGPMVMVRTELDALPMEEKTGLPHASTAKPTYRAKETFVAHGCGHGLDMAAWVGTAATLVDLKDQWCGTLMFVAQPAERILAGAGAAPPRTRRSTRS